MKIFRLSVVVALAALALSAQDLRAQTITPFTFRAPMDPYKIHQLPEFLVHSGEPTDIILQRSVFQPGAGGWHIHSGVSFVYVQQGNIKLQKFTEKEGCIETRVYGPGEAYFEIGNEVHRAVVVSQESAVLMVARLNIPVGGPITIPVPNPGCPFNEPGAGSSPPGTGLTPADLQPFVVRGTLDPFQIHQLPDFLMHSGEPSDIHFQQAVFPPGPAGWHTHPGSSFVYVVQGSLKLQMADKKEGCVESQVYGPGSVFIETGSRAHRAVVVSSENAVVLLVRFGVPVGAPPAFPATNPGC